MNEDAILVTERDMLRLKHILDTVPNPEDFEDLEVELDRARIISDAEVPSDLVTMNSTVRFLNVQDNKETVVTLVYPKDANSNEGKVSVLATLGSALLGLRVGQEINWMFPDSRTRTLRILEVMYQPEANEHWHL